MKEIRLMIVVDSFCALFTCILIVTSTFGLDSVFLTVNMFYKGVICKCHYQNNALVQDTQYVSDQIEGI